MVQAISEYLLAPQYIDCLFDSSATAGTGTGSVSKPGKTNNSKTGITAEEK